MYSYERVVELDELSRLKFDISTMVHGVDSDAREREPPAPSVNR